MSILRQIFGPSKDEIWRQLSDQIGGDFVKVGLFKTTKVEVHHKEWTITLDTDADEEQQYTRMRAPYVNKDGFRFTIYRKGIFVSVRRIQVCPRYSRGRPRADGFGGGPCNGSRHRRDDGKAVA